MRSLLIPLSCLLLAATLAVREGRDAEAQSLVPVVTGGTQPQP